MMKEELFELWRKIGFTVSVNLLNLFHKPEKKPLSLNSVLYMEIISAYPGRYTPSDLADKLRIARSAVTQKINALEKDGYLYRKRCTEDRRVYYLYPTEHFKSPTMDGGEKMFADMMRRFSEEELEKFCDMLDYMMESYTWHNTRLDK